MTEKSTVNQKEFLFGILIAVLISYFTTRIAFYLGFFFILFSILVGSILAEILRQLIKQPKTKPFYLFISIAIIFGGLAVAVMAYLDKYRYAAYFQVGYGLLTALVVYIRLSGVKIEIE